MTDIRNMERERERENDEENGSSGVSLLEVYMALRNDFIHYTQIMQPLQIQKCFFFTPYCINCEEKQNEQKSLT